MSYLSRRATLWLLWLLVVMGGALIGYLLLNQQPAYLLILAFLSLAVAVVALTAYWRGQQWPRYLIVAWMSLGVGLLNPEPYVTYRFSTSVLLAPVLALVLADWRWVLAAAATSYFCLLARAGWSGVYADPFAIGMIATLVSGMALSRYLTDLALARAEEQAEIIDRERASLARRVQERTQELASANARLLQTNQMKDAFMSSITHELRTPLNVILGNIELLQDEIYGPLEDQQQRALGTVEQSGRQLLGLINDILDLVKLEAGKFDFSFDIVSVSDVCAQCARLIRPHADQKSLTLELDIAADVGTIASDPQRLRQILLNLLSNAAKFTPEGGAIGLRARRAGDAVDLTVWDTGIGISAADQELLFQPFSQLDTRLARRYDGTGLGLALVAHLVAMHGGRIDVESSPGQGSSFTVHLPASQPRGPARAT